MPRHLHVSVTISVQHAMRATHRVRRALVPPTFRGLIQLNEDHARVHGAFTSRPIIEFRPSRPAQQRSEETSMPALLRPALAAFGVACLLSAASIGSSDSAFAQAKQ